MIESSVKVKVSVVIPFYNVEAYIGRCAECLMKQTYPWIEYIFVNDGSPDASEQVLKGVLSRFPHREVRIVKKENGGLPQARLTGLKEATGEYVLHVDSDDWMEENMVEKLLDAALQADADVAYCGFFCEKDHSSYARVDRAYTSGRAFSNDILIYCAYGYMW
nr:glycosyltransferase family 2 protein [Bacteroidales bacterium]